MRKIFLGGILVFSLNLGFPIFASDFEKNFLDALYGLEAYGDRQGGQTLRITHNGKSDTDVWVHEAVFANTDALKECFDQKSDDVIKFNFTSTEEISAFKKVIYFLYKFSQKDPAQKIFFEEGFFEDHDLPQLLILAFRYKINALGHAIASFLHEEMLFKTNTNEKTSIVLDRLSKRQLHILKDIVSAQLGKQKPNSVQPDDNMSCQSGLWLKNIYDNLAYYDYYMLIDNDPRHKKSGQNLDATLYQFVFEHRKRIEKTTRQNKRMRQQIQMQAAREAKVEGYCQKILNRVAKDMQNGRAIESTDHWVDKSLTAKVTERLIQKNPQMSIKEPLLINEWTGKTNLCIKSNERLTEGFRCAYAVGWIAQVLCCPLQCITGNFCDFFCINKGQCYETDVDDISSCLFCHFDSLSDECCLRSTQCGGAVAHGTYNAATCYKRALRIKIKPHGQLPPAPPPLRMEEDEKKEGKAVHL